MKSITQVIPAALLLCLVAAAQAQSKPASAPMAREIIPGSELMTSPERERYRERMRGAKSPEEQAKVRAEHTGQMRERARVRGLRLAEPLPGETR